MNAGCVLVPDWRSATIRTWVGMTAAVTRSFRRLRRAIGNSPPTGGGIHEYSVAA